MKLRCLLLGHRWMYHREKVKADEYRYTKKTCLRCGEEQLDWLGVKRGPHN